MRAGQPPVGGSRHLRARPRGRPARLPVRRLHPHAGGVDVPHRQQVLRLAVRVRAGAIHARPPDLPREGQGPRWLVEHQRPDLPARQSPRLRAVERGSGHGELGLRPVPALFQAHGDVPRRRSRRPVARALRAARPRARTGHEPAVPGVLRGLPGGWLPPDRGRQRLSPGGLRSVRSDHPRRPSAERLAGLPEARPRPQEPDRAHADVRHPRRLRRPAGDRRRHRAPGRRHRAHRGRRDHPRRRSDQHPAAAPAVGGRPGRRPDRAGDPGRRRPAGRRRPPPGPPRGLRPAPVAPAGLGAAVRDAALASTVHRRPVAVPAQRAQAPRTISRAAGSRDRTRTSPTRT